MHEKTIALMATLLTGITAFASPIVIGHRGASGYRPEHTLESYRLAIEQGADFIEPDLVSTKDGVLIARHENEISGTTDVATKFPDRKKTKTVDGTKVEGWFTEDFTLAEIKTLRAKERLPFRNQEFNFKFPIPTFAEILAFVAERQKAAGRTIGIVPELKHPTYFKSIGLPLESTFVKQVKEAKLDKADSPMIVQCFELETLTQLKKQIGTRLFFLYEEPQLQPYDFVVTKNPKTYGDLMTEKEIKELTKTIYGVGPAKLSLVNSDGTDNGKIALFHKYGIKVIPYTFRKEEQFISPFAKNDFAKELSIYFSLGIDGLFSDFPDLAVAARNKFNQRGKL